MLERFTDRARKVMSLANIAAKQQGWPSVAPEHVFLGIMKEGGGVAVEALRRCNVDLNALEDSAAREIESASISFVLMDVEVRTVPPMSWWRRAVNVAGNWIGSGRLPLGADTRRLVERAIKMAGLIGHNYVGTEHLLIAMLRQRESAAVRCLATQEVTSGRLRRQIVEILGLRKKRR